MYAFEYLKLNLNKYVRIKDVQEYCNKRTKEETGHPLGDPPRAFENLRKDKFSLESFIRNGYQLFIRKN